MRSAALALLVLGMGTQRPLGPHGSTSSPRALILSLSKDADSAFPDVTDRLSRVVPLAPGTPIRIDATIDDLTITGSDRSDLQIEIVRRAPSPGDLARFPPVKKDQFVPRFGRDDDRIRRSGHVARCGEG